VFGGNEASILSVAGSLVFGALMAGVFHAGGLWCLSDLKE
jgi:hypothetical protein